MNFFADYLKSTNCGLVLPKSDDDQISRYVRTHSAERDNFEQRPFRRQVDFWAFSVVVALALELDPKEGKVNQWGKTFIYTNQGILDNDLASLLAVVEVAMYGPENITTGDPKQLVERANRLAGAGCSRVLKELEQVNLRTTILDRTLDLAAKLLDEVRTKRVQKLN